LQGSTPSLERQCRPFCPHFETGIANSKKKNQKNAKLAHRVILRGLVSRKNIKLGIKKIKKLFKSIYSYDVLYFSKNKTKTKSNKTPVRSSPPL
jgi:hypothetical protein